MMKRADLVQDYIMDRQEYLQRESLRAQRDTGGSTSVVHPEQPSDFPPVITPTTVPEPDLSIKDDIRNYENIELEEDYEEDEDDTDYQSSDEEEKLKQAQNDKEIEMLKGIVEKLCKNVEELQETVVKQNKNVEELQGTVVKLNKKVEEQDEIIQKQQDEIDRLTNKTNRDFKHFTTVTKYNGRNICEISHNMVAYWHAGANLFDRMEYLEDATDYRMPGRRFHTREFVPPMPFHPFKTTYTGTEPSGSSSSRRQGASRRHPVVIDEEDEEEESKNKGKTQGSSDDKEKSKKKSKEPSEEKSDKSAEDKDDDKEEETSERQHGSGYMAEIFGRNPRECKILKGDSRIFQLSDQPWDSEKKG
jgi:uncharacterized coiled-coil protein SlyX